jgi:DNA-binding SARP family transcriptional activator
MGRLVGWIWRLLWLGVLLAGLPVALVVFAGWPLPDRWPDRQQLQRWVQQPLSASALVNTVAVLAWLLWAVLVYAVVIEVLTRLRRAVRWLHRLPVPTLPTPMQATAGGMLGAAMFGIGAHAPPKTAMPAPPVDAAAPGPGLGDLLPATPPLRLVSPAEYADNQRARADEPPGVALPDGGWLTQSTAAVAAHAAALVWLRRRRGYRPQPPGDADHRDAEYRDADLAPMPATVTAIQTQLHTPPGDAHDDEASVEQRATVVAPATVTAIGQQANQPLHPADLPAGGVGLTGVGAVGAARGVLAALLLATAPHGDGDRVISTTADLHALLGAAAAHLPGIHGLVVADNFDGALAALESELLRRGQPLSADRSGHAPGDHHPGPPVVVIAGCPTDTQQTRRLAVALTLGARLGATAVLLGAWPAGATWQVDAHGHTRPTGQPAPAGPRLCTLTVTATTDLLTLLRQAHPSPPASPAPTLPPPERGAVAGSLDHTPTGTPRAAPDPPVSTAEITAEGQWGGPLRLRLLGAVTIHHHATPVVLRRSAALQILAFLAVHAGGATGGQLIEVVWPGLRPHAGAGRLHTAVSSIRTALPTAASVEVVLRVGDRYRLVPEHLDVDLWRLRAAVHTAASALDPADRRRALQAVVGEYTGELAAGHQWPWLAPHREAVRRHILDAYAALAADEPDPRAAARLLQDGLRVDPFNEDLHQRAIRAYTATGAHAAAQAVLDGLTRRLAAVGLPPTAHTTDSAGRLPAHDRTRRDPDPPG